MNDSAAPKYLHYVHLGKMLVKYLCGYVWTLDIYLPFYFSLVPPKLHPFESRSNHRPSTFLSSNHLSALHLEAVRWRWNQRNRPQMEEQEVGRRRVTSGSSGSGDRSNAELTQKTRKPPKQNKKLNPQVIINCSSV